MGTAMRDTMRNRIASTLLLVAAALSMAALVRRPIAEAHTTIQREAGEHESLRTAPDARVASDDAPASPEKIAQGHQAALAPVVADAASGCGVLAMQNA